MLAALAGEARTLGAARRRSDSLQTLATGDLLCLSGMGAAAATRGARRLVQAGVCGLVSWGMAGGLDPGLAAGRIVLPAVIIDTDGRRFLTQESWRRRLALALGAEDPAADGTLLTSALPLHALADKQAALRSTGAAAVDMESGAVAAVAAAAGLPFLTVRVIVDTAGDILPGAVLRASRAGQVDLWRLLGGLARAPADIAPLLRLSRRYRAARRGLVRAARAGISPP